MIIGIVGGSGLYQLEGSSAGEFVSLETPYGIPSARYYRTTLNEHTLIFLPRHGEGHTLLPSEIPYQANIYGFKKLGAQSLVSISAVGSLRLEIKPGDIVLPSQYIDLTRGTRPQTFFGRGVVAHSLFAEPTCRTLRETIGAIATSLGAKVHPNGTYVCMEGPQFSTRAESQWYRGWPSAEGQVSVIGMTALPEAKLAREAGLCYQTVALATDYDCWNTEHGEVSLEEILKVLHQNVSLSKNLITKLGSTPLPACHTQCRTITKNSVVTAKELWPETRRRELEVILQ